jgi:hypothetical protein
MGLPVGIAEHNALVNSRLMAPDVGLDLLTCTVAVHAVSITERGQLPLEASIYVKHATSLRGEEEIDVRGLAVRGESLGDVTLVLEDTLTQVALKRLLAGLGGG